MQKHLLITISEEPRHLYGVRFVESFFRNKQNVKITLLHLFRGVDFGKLEGTHSPLNRKLNQAHMEKAQKALQLSREILALHGIPPHNITIELVPKQFGTVKDIIRAARAGLYDAVVLGRRGYSFFENVLMDSVTKEILGRDFDFPIWICRRPEGARENVLLCTDGSEPSLRMADHVGFMLQDEGDHTVTILHVNTGKSGAERIIEATKKRLLDNAFPEERIFTEVVNSPRVVTRILETAERGNYAVVAVGRAGSRKTGYKGRFVGSRSMKLLENLEKAALWISR